MTCKDPLTTTKKSGTNSKFNKLKTETWDVSTKKPSASVCWVKNRVNSNCNWDRSKI